MTERKNWFQIWIQRWKIQNTNVCVIKIKLLNFSKLIKYADQIATSGRILATGSMQGAFILTKFGQPKSIKEVQRPFRKKFYLKNPRQFPNILAFTRNLQGIKEESALRPQVSACRTSERLRNSIEAVKKFERNPKKPIREAERDIGLNYGAIWKIFEEESQVEGSQSTLDAVSESCQHGIKIQIPTQ